MKNPNQKSIPFDPYQMAIYLENILAIQESEQELQSARQLTESKRGEHSHLISKNTLMALAELHRSFPDQVPNGKK